MLIEDTIHSRNEIHLDFSLLTCSIVSAKIDRLVRFLEGARNVLFSFFLRKVFFAMVGSQSTLLFLWLKRRLPARYHLFTCPL